jgi:hypothetical protein
MLASRHGPETTGCQPPATPPPQAQPPRCSNPFATSHQNNRSTSRRSDGFPADFIGARPINSIIQPAGLPIATLLDQSLRGPVESALRATVRMTYQPALGATPVKRHLEH